MSQRPTAVISAVAACPWANGQEVIEAFRLAGRPIAPAAVRRQWNKLWTAGKIRLWRAGSTRPAGSLVPQLVEAIERLLGDNP